MLVICPICGQAVRVRERAATSVEPHGLDCGPFERFHDCWYECEGCGARLTEKEVEETLL